MRSALTSSKRESSHSGVSLLELLIVIVILGIISSLLIPQISPLRGTASVQVARQQQAQLQTALGSWIAAASARPGGLASARETYNNSTNRLALLGSYLQPATYSNLTAIDSDGVKSEALTEAGASLELTTWSLSAAPSVLWK